MVGYRLVQKSGSRTTEWAVNAFHRDAQSHSQQFHLAAYRRVYSRYQERISTNCLWTVGGEDKTGSQWHVSYRGAGARDEVERRTSGLELEDHMSYLEG